MRWDQTDDFKYQNIKSSSIEWDREDFKWIFAISKYIFQNNNYPSASFVGFNIFQWKSLTIFWDSYWIGHIKNDQEKNSSKCTNLTSYFWFFNYPKIKEFIKNLSNCFNYGYHLKIPSHLRSRVYQKGDPPPKFEEITRFEWNNSDNWLFLMKVLYSKLIERRNCWKSNDNAREVIEWSKK